MFKKISKLGLAQQVAVGFSGKVASLVAEITAASQEQTQGINQVNVALTQLDKAVQGIAANSEELSSAS